MNLKTFEIVLDFIDGVKNLLPIGISEIHPDIYEARDELKKVKAEVEEATKNIPYTSIIVEIKKPWPLKEED